MTALLLVVAGDARADGCLRGIPGAHVISFTSYTWYEVGIGTAEELCEACASRGDLSQRAACMQQGVENGWSAVGGGQIRSTNSRYEANLRTWVRDGIRETRPLTPDGRLYQPTAAEIDAQQAAVLTACPDLRLASVQRSNSQGTNNWLRARDCGIRVMCRGAGRDCPQAMGASSIQVGSVAVELFQTKAATEALLTGMSAPEEISFDDERITAIVPPAPPPYRGEAGRTRGITRRQLLRESAAGQARTGEQDAAYERAMRERTGCADQASYQLADGSTLCLRTGYERTPTVVARTMADVNAVTQRLLYRDLTAFAVRRVWESYSLALLMDPQVVGSCGGSGGQAGALQRVRSAIGVDAFLGSRTNPGDGLAALNSCFGGDPNSYDRDVHQLGLGRRVEDLATTARNMACGVPGDAAGRDSACGQQAAQSDDRGEGRRRHVEAFRRRTEDLQMLNQRRDLLKRGRFQVEGRAVTCGRRSCQEFFEWMEGCGPDYRVSGGCIPPGSLAEEERLAWTTLQNLNATENHILSAYPELASPMLTVDEQGRTVTQPAWQVTHRSVIAARDARGNCPYNGSRIACSQLLEEQYQAALRESRKKKLDLILHQACDDPQEFAKKLIVANPRLVNEFLDQAGPDAGALVCVGLAEAQADERSSQRWRAGATALMVALAAATALPTGGGSVALALGAASAAGAVGLTVADLTSAYSRMRAEAGLHHGCIGDFNRARQAEEALEDATIRAAIDLGVGMGVFAGMSAVQKIAQLRRFAQAARGIEGASPAWLGQAERAATLSRGMQRAEQALIAEEYALSEVAGLTGRGGALTREGRRAATAIGELEAMGVPKDVIQRALRSCIR